MLSKYQKTFEGENLTTFTHNVILFYVITSGQLRNVKVRIRDINVDGDTVWDVIKDGDPIAVVTIPIGELEGEVTGLSENLGQFDELALFLTDLGGGTITTPVVVQYEIEEDVSLVTRELGIACSNETDDLAVADAVVTFRMPYHFNPMEIRANVKEAPTGASLIVDIKKSGVSIFDTLLSIDDGEKTSTTATVPFDFITSLSLADDEEMTVDITQVGSTTAGKGLKLWIIGEQIF